MRAKQLFVAFISTLMLCAPLAVFAENEVTLRIILTGDHYILPPKKGRGGYAKLATVVKQERAGAEHSIFVHSGDAYSPSLLAGMVKGKHTVDMLNAVGLDYMVLGNHEWDFGMDILRERVWESNFPVLASNVVDVDGLPIDGTVRTAMVTVGSYRVGIMGLVTPETAVLSSAGTDRFQPVVKTAKALSKELKSQGANLIVALAHLDVIEDQELVNSGLADVVLSGHDHYFITWDNGNVVWMESGEDSEKVGVMDVHMKTVEKRGRKRFNWEADMRIVDTKNVAEDPEIAAKVKEYDAFLTKELDIQIGKTLTELDSRKKSVRGGETAIGNMIADAMRGGVDADIGLTNGGGIRAKKIYSPGTVLTRRDILTELPFGNVVVKLGLTGAQIREAIENGVSQAERTAGRFPQIAGMSFSWNPKADAGNRVVSVKVGGKFLDDARVYTVATNDYMAAGGDGYSVLKKGRVIIDASGATLMASMVMDYIKAKGSVSPKIEGRINPTQ